MDEGDILYDNEVEDDEAQEDNQDEESLNVPEGGITSEDSFETLESVNDTLEVDEALKEDNEDISLSNYETEISFIINEINEAKGNGCSLDI